LPADARTAIIVGFGVQAAATLPLAFVGEHRAWIVPLLILTFCGGVANLVAIVGYVVASTSGLPDRQQGLATGLVTMSQQVGIALGTPVMSAIITSRMSRGLLPGIRTAIEVNGVICLVAAVVIAVALRLPKAAVARDVTVGVEGR
jgi:predicted MFS family arabinose efflux permease